jgi:hypothetical protein
MKYRIPEPGTTISSFADNNNKKMNPDPRFFLHVTVNTHFFFWSNIYKKQHGARPCVEKMQFIFFVPPNEELEGTLHPQKIGCIPKNEGKRVHVPPDEKTCGHTVLIIVGKLQFLYARLKMGRIMVYHCPSVCPSVRPFHMSRSNLRTPRPIHFKFHRVIGIDGLTVCILYGEISNFHSRVMGLYSSNCRRFFVCHPVN